jgi:photosystem II stability/assembly factor-like uncharacterized protein
MLLKKCLIIILLLSLIVFPGCSSKSENNKESSVWTSLEGPAGTQIESLVISPAYSNDHIVYALTTSGLYLSSNSGTTWQYALTGIAPQHIISLAMSPDFANDDTIFAGTEAGVLRSTDSGKSWAWCNTGLIMPVTGYYGISFAFSPAYATDKTVFLSTISTVCRSDNCGESWSQIHTFDLGRGFTHLVCCPNFPQDKTLYIIGVGVYYSTDAGNSWQASSLTQDTRDLVFSDDFANDHTMFTVSDLELSMSIDGGNSWNKINSGIDTASVESVAISPQYSKDHILFVVNWSSAGETILRSTDKGNSWQTMYTEQGPSANVTALTISPSFEKDHSVFIGFYCGGISKSSNNGDSWQDISAGLPLSEMTPIAISPDFNADHTLFGFTATQGLFRSLDSGKSWQNIKIFDGFTDQGRIIRISPNYAADHILYVVDSNEISRSSDGGNTWQNFSSGLPSGVVALSLSPDFAHDNTLYAGIENNGIYRSIDGGNSWTQLDIHLQPNFFPALALSPAFATDNTIIISTATINYDANKYTGNIMKSTDRGDSWIDVTGNVTDTYTNGYGASISFSPVFATDHIVIANANKYIFISTDSGTTWSKKETGILQGFNPAAVSPDFDSDKTIFILNYYGLLYFSTDNGNSWNQIPNLPQAWIDSVVFSPTFNTDHVIFVGSSSGMFRGVFTAVPMTNNPITTNPNFP